MNGFFWPGAATGLPSASKPVLAADSCPGNGGGAAAVADAGAAAVADAGAAAAAEAGAAAAAEAGGWGDGGEVCAVEVFGVFGVAALGGGSSPLLRPQPARARITIDPKARPTDTLRRERANECSPDARDSTIIADQAAGLCRQSFGAKSWRKSLAAAFTAVSPAA